MLNQLFSINLKGNCTDNLAGLMTSKKFCLFPFDSTPFWLESVAVDQHKQGSRSRFV